MSLSFTDDGSQGSISIDGVTSFLIGNPYDFIKVDSRSVAFTKTGSGTASIKAGTVCSVASNQKRFTADTAVVMPVLTAGTDYAIYFCTDGTVRADSSFTNPTGYTTYNSRMIGGFHYGLVAPGTTVAGGSFATTGSGMIWTQGDVDNIAGINKFSLWDLKFRSTSTDPQFRGQKGFAYSALGNEWVAIYFASTDTDTNGLSKYNTNIASGTVVPKVPAAVGGNGTTTYASPTWWDFSEIAKAYGCRLISDANFNVAAFGVTESQSIMGAVSTYPTTLRNPGFTSRIGLEEATGHHYTWGSDSAGATSTAWIANGARGQAHADTIRRGTFGGGRGETVTAGSRSSNWTYVPGTVSWAVGLRAACDHMQPV